jgi:hypothetical protein
MNRYIIAFLAWFVVLCFVVVLESPNDWKLPKTPNNQAGASKAMGARRSELHDGVSRNLLTAWEMPISRPNQEAIMDGVARKLRIRDTFLEAVEKAKDGRKGIHRVAQH